MAGLTIKKLTLEEALRLYLRLRPYLPETLTSDYTVSFLRQIVGRMSARDYAEAVCLLTGKQISELDQIDSYEILEAFLQGLIANRLLDLVSFSRSLGL